MDTTHRDNPQYNQDRIGWKQELESFANSTQFIFLKILDFVDDDEIAYVTFKASLAFRGQDASFTEKSTFTKVGDRWFYKDGEVAP
jgi:SEC-C motif-containing protein